jgi:hypothetical protein
MALQPSRRANTRVHRAPLKLSLAAGVAACSQSRLNGGRRRRTLSGTVMPGQQSQRTLLCASEKPLAGTKVMRGWLGVRCAAQAGGGYCFCVLRGQQLHCYSGATSSCLVCTIGLETAASLYCEKDVGQGATTVMFAISTPSGSFQFWAEPGPSSGPTAAEWLDGLQSAMRQCGLHQSPPAQQRVSQPRGRAGVHAVTPVDVASLPKNIGTDDTQVPTAHRKPVPRRAATAMQRNGLFDAPAWIPDEEASACRACDTTFNIFYRRHHCRYLWQHLPRVARYRATALCSTLCNAHGIAHGNCMYHAATARCRVRASNSAGAGSRN